MDPLVMDARAMPLPRAGAFDRELSNNKATELSGLLPSLQKAFGDSDLTPLLSD
jgi:hypothetical protein